MRWVGVDENGLGPRLGPLVATAVSIDVPASAKPSRVFRAGERVGIDDSKVVAGFSRMAFAEGLALAIFEREHGVRPETVDRLLDGLSLSPSSQLRSRCPDSTVEQCWGSAVPLPAFGGDICEGHRVLDKLERAGIFVRRVRSALACASMLNEERSLARSKFDVDLQLFETLLVDAKAVTDGEIDAVCGMVGGLRKYASRFRVLCADRIRGAIETRGSSTYTIEGLGRVRFEIDADASHLPVSLASMVGKYVRELTMERQNRYYLTHDENLPRVSGYHDPKTASFIDRTYHLRRRLAIVSTCFEREG